MPQDVYAFGVILFELITGRPAFYRVNKTEIYLGERVRIVLTSNRQTSSNSSTFVYRRSYYKIMNRYQFAYSPQSDIFVLSRHLYDLTVPRSASLRVGYLVFGLIQGRETVEAAQPSDEFNLPRTMLDRRLEGTKFNECDVLRMMRVAARCTQKDPNARPLMREVGFLLYSLGSR